MNMIKKFSALQECMKWAVHSARRKYCKFRKWHQYFATSIQKLTEPKCCFVGGSSVHIIHNNPLEDILDTLPPESGALSPSDTLNTFRLLTEAFGKLTQSLAPFNVVQHKNFAVLRQAVKVSIPYMNPTEKFDVLKSIRKLAVPIDDEVFTTLITSLHENIYNLSLNEIMIMDNILISRDNPKITEVALELNKSLINRFNVKASQLPIGFDYFVRIRRLLQFIGRNQSAIKDEVFVNISKCMTKQNIDISNADEAMEIIILLPQLENRCDIFKPILDKAFDVWSAEDVTIGMVETTLSCLVKHSFTMTHNLFNDARFIEKCAKVAMNSGNVLKCFTIQRKFNRLDFTSKLFIHFLFEHLNDEEIRDSLTHNCIMMCITCDVADYRPPHFYDFLLPTLSTMNFHQQFDIKLNWPRFTLWLHRFGIHHQPLISGILKQKTHFDTIDANSVDRIESLQMEKVVDASVHNLLPDLKSIVGDNLRLLVHTNNDIIIPLLLKIDVHSNKFVPFEVTETNSIETIHCDANESL